MKKQKKTIGEVETEAKVVRLTKLTMVVLRDARNLIVQQITDTIKEAVLREEVLRQYTGPGWQNIVVSQIAHFYMVQTADGKR